LATIGGCVLEVLPQPDAPARIRALYRSSASEGRLSEYEHDGERYRRFKSAKLKPDSVERYGECIDNDDCCP
jgi:hypothetical protein